MTPDLVRAVTYATPDAAFVEGTLTRDADARLVLSADAPPAGAPRVDGVIVTALTDWHVHTALVDVEAVANSALGAVVDLGAVPDDVAALASGPLAGRLAVSYAGAFLTPVGGYPSDRSWAPAGSVVEIADAAAARRAVARMAGIGAAVIKVASNSVAGAVFDDALLATIVRAADARGLSVVAHAEGAGEAVRAAHAGARMLAHAPFTERLTDDEIDTLASTTSWISTLDIHGFGAGGAAFDIACDNVRRFFAAGGRVRYGTDMGNGPIPPGINARELTALEQAGIRGADLVRTLTPGDPLAAGARLVLVPRTPAGHLDLAAAHPLTLDDLQDVT